MLILIKTRSFLLLTFPILLIFSCSQKSHKSSGNQESGREEQSGRQEQTEVCYDGVVKELLGDGRTALVQSTKSKDDSFLWNYLSQTVKKEVIPIFETDILNDSGNLLLRSFDTVRFQIQETNNSNGTFRDLRLFRRGSNPIVKFSQSGDFLLSTRRRGSSFRNRIDVLDIYRRDIIWDAQFNRIISAELKDSTRGAVVTINQGYYQLNIFNPSSRIIERGIRLEGRGFSDLALSETLVQVKMGNNLLSFDGISGELLSRIQLTQLIDVDKNSDYALIASDPFNYNIVDLKTGNSVRRVLISPKDRLSSCQLNFRESIVACVDPTKVSSIHVYDLQTLTKESVCLSGSL